MQPSDVIVKSAALVWLFSTSLTAQTWTLPERMAVKDTGPRTYRFVVDHTVTTTTGHVVQRQRVSGEYTRGLPGPGAMWKNVTVAESNGPAELTSPGQKREFMEGFRYRVGRLDDTMKPDFFKSFPPTAIFERNLVWDTGMLEMFGQDQFALLKLNVPYRLMSSEEVHMPGVGRFQNRDVYLTWIGRSQRNGTECALIGYRAFFNPLEIANGGMTLTGRSHVCRQLGRLPAEARGSARAGSGARKGRTPAQPCRGVAAGPGGAVQEPGRIVAERQARIP